MKTISWIPSEGDASGDGAFENCLIHEYVHDHGQASYPWCPHLTENAEDMYRNN